MTDRINKTDAEWRASLTPEQYRILREKGTELPFSGEYVNMGEDGTYHCIACGNELFRSDAKFDAHCGWPSFDRAASEAAVKESVDKSHGMVRTEITCSVCDGHLGHVFTDGPTETGVRYCINSTTLKLVRKS